MATIRTATPEDIPFLREMLYAAIFVPAGAAPPPPGIVDEPAVARYLTGFGRPGDHGLIASDGADSVGAAWYRLLGPPHPGYGYVADGIPELTVAVRADRRGRGLGSLLLARLMADAHGQGWPALSLSVHPGNPARRLYERLGFVPAGEGDGALTMLRAA